MDTPDLILPNLRALVRVLDEMPDDVVGSAVVEARWASAEISIGAQRRERLNRLANAGVALRDAIGLENTYPGTLTRAVLDYDRVHREVTVEMNRNGDGQQPTPPADRVKQLQDRERLGLQMAEAHGSGRPIDRFWIERWLDEWRAT